MQRTMLLAILCLPVLAGAAENGKGVMCVRNVCLKTELQDVERLPWGTPLRNKGLSYDTAALFTGMWKETGDQAMEGIRTDSKDTARDIIQFANEYGQIRPIALPLHSSTFDYIHKIQRTCDGGFLGGRIKDTDGSVIDIKLSPMPGQQINGRQLWRVSEIAMFTPGTFSEEQKNQFARSLADKFNYQPLRSLPSDPVYYYNGRYGKDAYQTYSLEPTSDGLKVTVKWNWQSEMKVPALIGNDLKIRSKCIGVSAAPKI